MHQERSQVSISKQEFQSKQHDYLRFTLRDAFLPNHASLIAAVFPCKEYKWIVKINGQRHTTLKTQTLAPFLPSGYEAENYAIIPALL